MQNNIQIVDLEIGKNIEGCFYVLKEFERKISRQDKPYYNIKLGDKSGEIRGKLWSLPEGLTEQSLAIGDIVVVSGLIQEYNAAPQIMVNAIEKATSAAPEDFLPITSRNRADMAHVLEVEIEKTQNPHLKKLLQTFWQNQELKDKFINFPAAEYVHHGYVGGLIEHVYEMNELTRPFLSLYPNLDRDLLFTGLFFHDIGKLEELDIVGATFVRTTEGKLVAHIGQGLLMVDRMVNQTPDFPELLRDKLYHLILSHQGELEFGSPIKPQMLEALVLSFIDNNSAFMNQAVKHIERNIHTGEPFTDYHKWLGRSLWQGDYLIAAANPDSE
jgi:3'-5' exoribonuclease